MALIDDVRTALRIKSTAYDSDLEVYVQSCLYDLERVNIQTYATDDNDNIYYPPEVTTAVIAYVKSQFGSGSEDKKQLWFSTYEKLRLAMFLDKDKKRTEV